MLSTSPIALLFSLAGSVTSAAPTQSEPPTELAETQLRAGNHRLVNVAIGLGSNPMDAMIGEDFLLTDGDGTWHDRAGFLAQMRRRAPQHGSSDEDMRVRLFGPVALLHGVFGAAVDGVVSKVRYTDVHVWAGSAWRLVSAHNTPLRSGVPAPLQSGTAPSHKPWQGQDPTGDDFAVLRALNENYVKAFRESDVAWYDAHLAPDYVVISSDGSFHDRAAALANFAKPTFATHMKSFPVDRVTVRRFGDVALIHAENAYELKDGRKGVSRYTDIWHKRDGRWLCIAAHITAYKAPA